MLHCLLKCIYLYTYFIFWTAGTLELRHNRVLMNTDLYNDTFLCILRFENVHHLKRQTRHAKSSRRYFAFMWVPLAYTVMLYPLTHLQSNPHYKTSHPRTQPTDWPLHWVTPTSFKTTNFFVLMQIYSLLSHKVISETEHRILILNNPKIWAGIAQLRYRLDNRVISVRLPEGSRKFYFLHNLQTGSDIHLASWKMCIWGTFTERKETGVWSWLLTSI
jgi:hypothetical protein